MNLNRLNLKIKTFSQNLINNIKAFPAKFQKMTLGEQIAYGCIVVGGILVIVSLFLF